MDAQELKSLQFTAPSTLAERAVQSDIGMLIDQKSLAKCVAVFDDDRQYRDMAYFYGLRALACLLDGLDPGVTHVLKEFSESNQFAHTYWRGHESDEAL